MSECLKILVVDDEPSNREIIRVGLMAEGHAVVTAANGAEAVCLCFEEAENAAPFDVVVMDVQMPVLDGLEAVRLLRTHAPTRALAILCCSGLVSPASQEEGRQAGCDHYLTKPFRRSELADAVRLAHREAKNRNRQSG